MATIKIEIDDNDLWGAIWGSGFESDPVNRNWLMDYEYINGNWDVSGLVKIRYIPESGDPYKDTKDESKWAERTITLEHLAEALSLAIKEGYRHVPCGGLIDADLERFDSCVADILLQLTVYGKEVWA